MRKTLTAAAVLAVGLLARAMMPATAQADYGRWAAVCCGSQCWPDGKDYCLGTGQYSCCK
jgi:hypothetical protein